MKKVRSKVENNKQEAAVLYGVDFTSGEMLVVLASSEEEARAKALKLVVAQVVSGTIESVQYIELAEDEPKCPCGTCKGANHEEVDCNDAVLRTLASLTPTLSTGVDVVKEPPHYQHGTFEVIDEMVIAFGYQKTIDFCILNAWKYRSRAPYKGKAREDMDKANRYMEYAFRLQNLHAEVTNGYGTDLLKPGSIKRKG